MLASSSSAVSACFLDVNEAERSPYTLTGAFLEMGLRVGLLDFGRDESGFDEGEGLESCERPPISPISSIPTEEPLLSPSESSSASNIGFLFAGCGLLPKGFFLMLRPYEKPAPDILIWRD